MIYIDKGKQPPSLIAYKKEKYAYYDGFQSKDDIRECLLKEQGYLCAYCMRRIDMNHMKIEHWYPQSEFSRDIDSLEYKNMLGVCLGHKEGTEKSYDTCDTHKGNDLIKVNPLDESTLSTIKYRTSTGEIYSDDDEINQDINIILNLNSDKHMLKENRKALLDELIKGMSKKHKNGTWQKKDLESIIKMYSEFGTDGKKKEYAGIVLWYFNKCLHRS